MIKSLSVLMISVLVCLFSQLEAYAAPVINNKSGTMQDGKTFTISGIDFGTKSSAAPVKWDNFENGTPGALLSAIDSSWNQYDGGSEPHSAAYSDVEKHSGTLSAYNDPVTRARFATNYYTIQNPTDEIFVAYWFKAVSTVVGSPDGYMVGKQTRVGVEGFEYNAPYSGPGAKLSDYRANTETSPLLFYNPGDGGIPEEDWKRTTIPWNTWVYIQLYEKLSSPAGTANGEVWCDSIGYAKTIFSNVVTRKSGYTFQVDSMWLGLAADNFDDSVFDLQVYIDDVYIDTTQSRIEIGDNSDYNLCTHREIQIPSFWSPTSASFKVNQGTFGDTDTVYIFIVDSDGNASTGEEVIFGSTYGNGNAAIASNINSQFN